ncbi:MAG: hypothetical protein WD489_10835 [Rhodovibrionaceae bacterium]
MNISQQSLETLIDLVEIKLSCIEVWDKDDRRELKQLERARDELYGLQQSGQRSRNGAIVHELRAA